MSDRSNGGSDRDSDRASSKGSQRGSEGSRVKSQSIDISGLFEERQPGAAAVPGGEDVAKISSSVDDGILSKHKIYQPPPVRLASSSMTGPAPVAVPSDDNSRTNSPAPGSLGRRTPLRSRPLSESILSNRLNFGLGNKPDFKRLSSPARSVGSNNDVYVKLPRQRTVDELSEADSEYSQLLGISRNAAVTTWEFPGWGSAGYITAENLEMVARDEGAVYRSDTGVAHQGKLGELRATALSGNDISSSCLYVSAQCSVAAGIYAPIALLLVGALLYVFRKVYSEVGTALPLNGGAYNVLLNTTSKRWASLAACLSMISYIATGVVSGTSAVDYLLGLFSLDDSTHLYWLLGGTILLLAFFAFLNFVGISESANVAVFIFIVHLGTLSAVIIACIVSSIKDGNFLKHNLEHDQNYHPMHIMHAIFFGFVAAMLGISGFETSANFIEEQQDGVFVKTLRNMWILVTFFNPVICILSMCILPMDEILHKHQNDLLSAMARRSGGHYFSIWVSINAFMVLSGAVLTSYVGILGLVRRMALDRVMPQFLLIENKWRKTKHWIIILFLLICTALILFSQGKMDVLSRVYTQAFLCVMILFALGNILLKVKRAKLVQSLPSHVTASWFTVIVAMLAVMAAFGGVVYQGYKTIYIFVLYFGLSVVVVYTILFRVAVLKGLHALVDKLVPGSRLSRLIRRQARKWVKKKVIFFMKVEHLDRMVHAAEYVMANEQARRMVCVHVIPSMDPGDDTHYGPLNADLAEALKNELNELDNAFPTLQLDFMVVEDPKGFNPDLLDTLSHILRVQHNLMFIGCPSHDFENKYGFQVADLGGVRVIV